MKNKFYSYFKKGHEKMHPCLSWVHFNCKLLS